MEFLTCWFADVGGEEDGDGRRGIGQIDTGDLEIGFGAPDADVGAVVRADQVNGGDQFVGGARVGGVEGAEVGGAGLHAIGDAEIDKSWRDAGGDVPIDACVVTSRPFSPVMRAVNCTRSPGYASRFDKVRSSICKLFVAIGGIDVEFDAGDAEFGEAALQDVAEGDGGGERGLEAHCSFGRIGAADGNRFSAGQFNLARDREGDRSGGALGAVDGIEDGHLEKYRGEIPVVDDAHL